MIPRVIARTALAGLLLCSASVFAAGNAKTAQPKKSVKSAATHAVQNASGLNDVICVEALDKLSKFEPMQQGKVESVSSGKLTITGAQDSKPHAYTLSADTAVTCDGKVCQASDLKPGTKVRVAIWPDKQQDAARVEAIQKHSAFDAIHDGKFVSLKNKSLVMSNMDNKTQHTYKLIDKAMVTRDGKSAKLDDLKPGMKIRIITESTAPVSVSEAKPKSR